MKGKDVGMGVLLLVNFRRACAGGLRQLVCVPCLLPLERLFVMKILSRTQRATEVKQLQ